MHVLITGAAGMIGRKLTARLVKDGGLNGEPIDQSDVDRRGRAGKARRAFQAENRRASDCRAPGVARKPLPAGQT